MRTKSQRGFSMIELLIASLVLLFGVAAVVQLVPQAMQANLRSKQDSTAMVVAERLMDQFLSQNLTTAAFVNADGQNCSLGNPAAPNAWIGHPVIAQNNRPIVNFGVTAITAGYGYNWSDPNDPSGPGYEIRWAVVTRTSGTTPVHKRFLIGVWKRGRGGQNVVPVMLEGAVGR